MAIDLESLLVQHTKAEIYETALGLARALGLPVSTWQAGDPTRSLYHLEAQELASLEELVAGYISSGFLDYATGMWLKILAEQVFGVEVSEATYATTTITLTNTGGGLYEVDVNEYTFKNSTTGKTYHNTTSGIIASGPGTTLDLTVVADEAGTDSNAAAGEIDEIISGPLGVTCTNDEAAVATDEPDEDTIRQQCRDKLGALSPNGPREAYSYVARNSALTGTTAVTRVRVYVTIYLAGSSGGVAEPDRALVESALATWATPVCITPTVLAATNVSVAVTYQLWIYSTVNKTSAEIEEEVEEALEALFASRPIGGDIIPPAVTGSLYRSLIESTIRSLYDDAFRVTVSAPSGDTALTNGQVATLGTVTPTVTLVTP
jgi:hypothetical protein